MRGATALSAILVAATTAAGTAATGSSSTSTDAPPPLATADVPVGPRQVAAPAWMRRLGPGEQPPQFVVFSFDGVGSHTHWQRMLSIATRVGAHFTGLRYDSSRPSNGIVWPTRTDGFWEFWLPTVVVPALHRRVIMMDYNLWYAFNQVHNQPARAEEFTRQTKDTYRAAYQARPAETGRRWWWPTTSTTGLAEPSARRPNSSWPRSARRPTPSARPTSR